MKTASFLFFWLAFARIGISAEQYTLDAGHSELGFQVRNFASNVIGKFTEFSGTVIFNPAQPERSSVEATIQVQSIDTGIKDRDHHLLSTDFFDAQKFPTMTRTDRRCTWQFDHAWDHSACSAPRRVATGKERCIRYPALEGYRQSEKEKLRSGLECLNRSVPSRW
jgi:YceI-like domain